MLVRRLLHSYCLNLHILVDHGFQVRVGPLRRVRLDVTELVPRFPRPASLEQLAEFEARKWMALGIEHNFLKGQDIGLAKGQEEILQRLGLYLKSIRAQSTRWYQRRER